MKRLFIPGFLGLLLLPHLGLATDTIYTNNGYVTFPPQIDAITVINNGTFDFTINSTQEPFDTSNTQNFTNNGAMFGAVGFQFDNAPSTVGYRKPSANFHNSTLGFISAEDSGRTFILIDGNPSTRFTSSYLLVDATNIVNEGYLVAGGSGIIRLTGTNINLTRSGVEIQPIVPRGSINGFATNFFIPDIGIYDYYWGQSNQVLNSANIIQNGGTRVVSPNSLVTFASGLQRSVRVQVDNPVGDFLTNSISFTNLMVTNMNGAAISTNVPTTNIVQAVFVGVPNGAFWDVRFTPTEDSFMSTASVEISVPQTNAVTLDIDLISLFLVDTLASTTNRGFYTNFTSPGDLRPQNYLLSRLEPTVFANGTSPGNGPPFPTNLFYLSDFASRTVTNDYSAYAAYIDDLSSRPPDILAGTVTNFPGRVEIRADTLNLNRTRFRANGLIDIQARNLVNSSNTVIDSENLGFNLGASTNTLNFKNLAAESVFRLNGTNYVWSGYWTNYENMLIDNYVQDTVNSNLYILTPITNVVEYRIYAMIFDASKLLTQLPVTVNSLLTHSTNVVINDNMTVVDSLLFDATSLTLNGNLTLSNKIFNISRSATLVVSLENWVGTNAPNLKYFTNNGTLTIPNDAHFGDDTATPYSAFVNNGTIDAFGQRIQSSYVEINGENTASADISITANSAKIQGFLNAGGDINFFGNDLRFLHASVRASGRLNLFVTNTMSDAGGSSGNSFVVDDGFNLFRKPATGDLLGTSVNSIAPPFAEVDHVWGAADLGATSAGYQNNAALGSLVLTPGRFENNFPPLFFFQGTGGGNGLYVDVLDLSHLADYQNEIAINPDLVIYYASAKLSFTPPMTNGAAQSAEEFLNGQFNGHLRWVRDFAGPNSSVAVVQNGVSVLVNRALRESLIIDSDGDGVPNGLDFFPFDSSLLAKLAVVKPPMTAVLSWNGQAHKIYSVESATNFISPNWQRILYYTNSANTNGTITIQIPVATGSPRQFYRVGTAN